MHQRLQIQNIDYMSFQYYLKRFLDFSLTVFKPKFYSQTLFHFAQHHQASPIQIDGMNKNEKFRSFSQAQLHARLVLFINELVVICSRTVHVDSTDRICSHTHMYRNPMTTSIIGAFNSSQCTIGIMWVNLLFLLQKHINDQIKTLLKETLCLANFSD